jgi:hypothetical protein
MKLTLEVPRGVFFTFFKQMTVNIFPSEYLFAIAGFKPDKLELLDQESQIAAAAAIAVTSPFEQDSLLLPQTCPSDFIFGPPPPLIPTISQPETEYVESPVIIEKEEDLDIITVNSSLGIRYKCPRPMCSKVF